jgi:triacylglycerol esterase/lipase EstA (alpha/beta hydrolase family)
MMANVLRFAALAWLVAALAYAAPRLAEGRIAAGLIGAALILLAFVPVMALQVVILHAVNAPRRGLLPGHEAHVAAPPRARLGQLLRSWLREMATFVAVFMWRQPFRTDAVADVPPGTRALPGSDAGARRGVVLVHGFCCNRAMWNPWLERLRAKGIPTTTVNLEPVFGSISAYPPIVEDAVRRMTEAIGQPPVLVGHSMGGLAARAWLRVAGPGAIDRVHHVVTIGTPHHGTWVGRLAPARNAREMALDSVWLRGLREGEAPGLYRRFTCFWSHCDNIVFPASTATLPGADNRHIPGVAHVDLINVSEVFAEVVRRCAEPATSKVA